MKLKRRPKQPEPQYKCKVCRKPIVDTTKMVTTGYGRFHDDDECFDFGLYRMNERDEPKVR